MRLPLGPARLGPRPRGKVPPWVLALLLIAVGVVGRLVLWTVPNVETVLVVSLLAGMLLGGAYVVLVPVGTMLLTDAVGYAMGWAGAYSPAQILGLAAFVYSGFVVAASFGRIYRPKVLFRVRTIAVMTTISVPATVLFDLWTAFGDWVLISSQAPFHWSFAHVLELQLPFTLVHVASSLLFVPLFGTMFLHLHVNGWPAPGGAPDPRELAGRT